MQILTRNKQNRLSLVIYNNKSFRLCAEVHAKSTLFIHKRHLPKVGETHAAGRDRGEYVWNRSIVVFDQF